MVIKTLNKTEQVKKYLLDAIHHGKLRPGDCVIPEVKLAAQLGVSTMCTRKAFADLKKDGMIRRIAGKGTFIADSGRILEKKYVILLIPLSGHIHQETGDILLQGLHDRGFLPITLDSGTSSNSSSKSEEDIQRMIDLDPSAMIVLGGSSSLPYDLIKKNEKKLKKLIFLGENVLDYKFNADYVISDEIYGRKLALRHLLKLGHKKILYLTHKHILADNEKLYARTSHCQGIEVYRKLLTENNLQKNEMIFLRKDDIEVERNKIREIFSGKERPTAVLCSTDFWAATIMNCVRKLGLRVPEDVAITGYFNTPWCINVEVPLTSVSVHEDKIARALLDLVSNESKEKQKIIIKPSLIVRESCGSC